MIASVQPSVTVSFTPLKHGQNISVIDCFKLYALHRTQIFFRTLSIP